MGREEGQGLRNGGARGAWAHAAFLPLPAPLPPALLPLPTPPPCMLLCSPTPTPPLPPPLHPPCCLCPLPPSPPLLPPPALTALPPLSLRAQRVGPWRTGWATAARSRWPPSASSAAAVTGRGPERQTRGFCRWLFPAVEPSHPNSGGVPPAVAPWPHVPRRGAHDDRPSRRGVLPVSVSVPSSVASGCVWGGDTGGKERSVGVETAGRASDALPAPCPPRC